jgi:hypothetical protein
MRSFHNIKSTHGKLHAIEMLREACTFCTWVYRLASLVLKPVYMCSILHSSHSKYNKCTRLVGGGARRECAGASLSSFCTWRMSFTHWYICLLICCHFSQLQPACGTCADWPSGITSPLEISGHKLWLDGNDIDGDGVSDADQGYSDNRLLTLTSAGGAGPWVDKSNGGSSYPVSSAGSQHPSQSFNRQNGLAMISFTGSTPMMLDITSFYAGATYTIMTIVRQSITEPVSSSPSHIVSSRWRTGADAALYTEPSPGNWKFYDPSGGGDQHIASTTALTFDHTHLFGVSVAPVASDSRGIFDDLLHSSATYSTTSSLEGLRIGNGAHSGSNSDTLSWNGHIGG